MCTKYVNEQRSNNLAAPQLVKTDAAIGRRRLSTCLPDVFSPPPTAGDRSPGSGAQARRHNFILTAYVFIPKQPTAL